MPCYGWLSITDAGRVRPDRVADTFDVLVLWDIRRLPWRLHYLLAHEPVRRIELPIPVWKTGVSPQHFTGLDLAYLDCFHDSVIMAHTAPPDPDVRADARNRSFRSLVQGLALDVAVAVVLVLTTAFTAIEWTPEYWKLLGLTVAKSVLQSGASYWMRILVKPREE